MAVRPAMAALIIRTRELIGDTASPQTFTDQQVQDQLDVHKTFVRYAPLTVDPTRANGGILSYNVFFAKLGDWETDAALVGPSYQALTPATSDYVVGQWTFATNQPLPVFLVGQTYDLFGAARDLLRRWAGIYATAFTFTADGATFQRGAIQQQLRDLANEYELQMRATYAPTRRHDIGEEATATLPVGLIETEY